MTPLKDTFKLVVSTSHKMHVEGFRQHILKAEQMLNTELPKLRFHIETDQAPALLALVKEAREALNYYFLPTHRKNEDIEMVKMQDLLSKIDKTLES